MDLSSLGGFLGGFLLGGILLPICVSFIADGVVMYFRGRGPFRMIATTALTAAFVGLYLMAASNALVTNEYQQLSSSIGLILWFSIPAAAIGFGVRMLAMFLNPASKALDQKVIQERKARHAARHSSARPAASAADVRHA
jgi:hypothetical protein